MVLESLFWYLLLKKKTCWEPQRRDMILTPLPAI